MSISGPDDAKTPTKVRQPPAKRRLDNGQGDAKTPTKVRQPPAKRRLDNGQGWLSTCLLQAQQQPVLMSI